MKVKIIGGSGGVSPGSKATSYLINENLLIDAGSIAEGLPIEQQVLIDYILISHPHLDHIKDLAFLSDNCFGLRKKPFEVYSGQSTKDAIKNHLMNNIIWPDFSVLPDSKNPTMRFHTIEAEENLSLGAYKITPIGVNHPSHALGFIVEFEGKSLLFTQDTGQTQRIWEVARMLKGLMGIFTEVSFPNHLHKLARESFHMTPQMLREEIKKMPKDVPIFLGHVKPNFQELIYQQVGEVVQDLGEERVTLLEKTNGLFQF